MTTKVSNENMMETINNNQVPETSSDAAGMKRKISMVDELGKTTTSDAAAKPSNITGRTLSHAVSMTGIDVFDDIKGRDEYASEIPTKAVNLCSASFGAKVLFATDEWFAKADNLLKDDEPLFDEDAYCEQGKVMDGWESRRRREEGHDWCLIQLGVPYWTSAAPLRATSPRSKLQLVGIELDTAHFTGNHTPQVSIELARGVSNPLSLIEQLPNGVERLLQGGRQGTGHSPREVAQAQHAISGLDFETLLPKTPLRPGHEATRYHYFPMDTPIDLSWSKKENAWVKLNYFPDGGVARMRFWAVEIMESESDEPFAKKQKKDMKTCSLYMPVETGPVCTVVPHGSVPIEQMPSQTIGLKEISSDQHGGKGVACSNKHYGEPWRLIQTTLGQGMWDGWETARHSHRPQIVEQDPVTKLSKTPLNDWAILKLGTSASSVKKVILDTRHFLGNYPESILLEGCYCEPKEEDNEAYWKSLEAEKVEWFPLVARTRMSPNSEHLFDASQLQNTDKPMTHVRLSIYPDGGCSRVRIYV